MQSVKVLCCFVLFCVLLGGAQAVQFEILDPQGNPVRNVVLTFEEHQNPAGSQVPTSATMSQADRQFKPHILVVPRNTPVTFPNYDDIAHHVYSFSDAKTFEKKLHKGDEVAPVIFDKAGIVELGCNVHDWMLAYVYVTDSLYYGVSNEHGSIDIQVPEEGTHKVRLWHPRLNDAEQTVRELTLSGNKHVIKLKHGVNDQDDFEFDDFGDY